VIIFNYYLLIFINFENDKTKITNYIKAQRLQWFRYAMRRDKAKAVRVNIEYQSSRKRSRGRPRKGWFDRVSQDLRTLDVED
jgi:hypothetical protein